MKNTIIVFVFMLLASGCSKDDKPQAQQDQLPPITQIGANTAGCIINGKVLIPKNGINSTSGFTTYGLDIIGGVNFNNPPYGNDYFSIKFANLKDKGKSYWIYIHINNMINGVGLYTIGQSNGEFYADASNNPQIIVRETYNNVSGKTFLSSENSGNINITCFDFTNNIISGTFTATLYNEDNPTETIQVTDGRFDIRI